jgi:uncharacterized protein
MSSGETLESVSEVRQWNDTIPFHYEYTAGIAGEKFLRGLMAGKILAGFCPACKELSLPARIYCVRCYGAITKYVKVGPVGKVKAMTKVGDGGEGSTTFVYVTFEGVRGGMIHRLLGRARVGSHVSPRFRPKSQRTGSILDIQGFALKG